jgi:hypothetical protein
MAHLIAEGAQKIPGMEVRVRSVDDKRAPVSSLVPSCSPALFSRFLLFQAVHEHTPAHA